jgi:hypothetical protein
VETFNQLFTGKSQLFTKNDPILSILHQIKRFEHTFQNIFYALHESNNKNSKKLFLFDPDLGELGLLGGFRVQ